VGWVYNGAIAGAQAFKLRFLVLKRTVIPRPEKRRQKAADFIPG